MNVVCNQCFTTNRMPDDKEPTEAKCGKCGEIVYNSKPVELSDNTFYAYVERNDYPVIVDYWASWCGPCQNMAPIFSSVAAQSSQLLFAKVNTEQAQQVATEAGIRSIPTLIFFHHGKEIDRISGGLNEPQMKNWIMSCIQKLGS